MTRVTKTPFVIGIGNTVTVIGEFIDGCAVVYALGDNNLNNPAVTTCLIGASRAAQIDDSVAALNNLSFSAEELAKIDGIVR